MSHLADREVFIVRGSYHHNSRQQKLKCTNRRHIWHHLLLFHVLYWNLPSPSLRPLTSTPPHMTGVYIVMVHGQRQTAAIPAHISNSPDMTCKPQNARDTPPPPPHMIASTGVCRDYSLHVFMVGRVYLVTVFWPRMRSARCAMYLKPIRAMYSWWTNGC